MPDKIISFEGQKPDEKMLMLGRKHPFVLGKMGLILVACALIIVALFLKLGMSTAPAISFLIFLAVGGVYFLRSWFLYSRSIYIITSHRVIGMDQTGFFAHRVSESALDKIVNVSYEIKGMVKTLLNFGTLVIQTSGSGNESSIIKLVDIPSPNEVQRQIASAAKDYADTEVKIDLGKNQG